MVDESANIAVCSSCGREIPTLSDEHEEWIALMPEEGEEPPGGELCRDCQSEAEREMAKEHIRNSELRDWLRSKGLRYIGGGHWERPTDV
jgi:DNA-directed RNA polymerase subunit RPC12/RpoP